jgi:UDP-GlcNAc3NAcA epimerase
MKIVTVIGARPQFIKAAVVSKALKESGIEEVLVHTGQHYDENMSGVFFTEMGIPVPDYNLEVGSGSHGKQTGEMLIGVEKVLMDEKPDYLLVYGDTNSTIAGALAASKLHIPIAHVESGLRSFNRRMPEEINRILTDAISGLLFVPTQNAIDNLKNEGVPDSRIFMVGDVMYDASKYFGEVAEKKSSILKDTELYGEDYILLTIHRAENTDDKSRIHWIMDQVNRLSDTYQFVFPMHPRTRKKLQEEGIQLADRIKILAPLGYLDMLMLEKHAALILTDSGGIQKEAYFMQRPCITFREQTEWVELVENGFNKLLQTDMNLEKVLQEMSHVKIEETQLYGDGRASYKIASLLLNG